MPSFIQSERLAEAVLRLQNSRAAQQMADFLVIKRALFLDPAGTVTLSTRNTVFQQAIDDMMACDPEGSRPEYAAKPFVNIYGTGQHDDRGYRSPKFRSNGTAVTVPHWRDSVVQVLSENPKVVALRPDYLEGLPSLLLKGTGDRPLPRLDDATIWFFRAKDISDASDASTALGAQLVEAYKKQLGLTSEEIAALFLLPGSTSEEVPVSSRAADPSSYLPAIEAPPRITEPSVDPAQPACSFDLVVTLGAKGFTILTGPSGTGKTRAALDLAQALASLTTAGHDTSTAPHVHVAVGANWTDTRPILGYPNPFGPLRQTPTGESTNETYQATDILRLLLRAAHPDRSTVPHIIILDEMNLSHVERYFSPFLSLMEANRGMPADRQIPILPPASMRLIAEVLQAENPLALDAQSAQQVAQSGRGLLVGPNVFIVGTVNVDETTYMFSPKVLDRAHVLELQPVEPAAYIAGATGQSDTIAADHALALLQDSIGWRETGVLDRANPQQLMQDTATLLDLPPDVLIPITAAATVLLAGSYKLLEPVGFPFGFRVINEVFGYLLVWLKATSASQQGDPGFYEGWPTALDKAFLQKVLPKIHGNRRQLGTSLTALAAFLMGNDKSGTPAARYQIGDAPEISIEPDERFVIDIEEQMPLSCAKLTRMSRSLSANSYVTFVE